MRTTAELKVSDLKGLVKTGFKYNVKTNELRWS